MLKRNTLLARPGSKVLLALVTFELVLVGLHTYSRQAALSPFMVRLLNLDQELTLGVIFTSTQLLVTSLAALLTGLRVKSLGIWQRVFLWILAATFLLLGIDEYFLVHEALNDYLETCETFATTFGVVGDTSPWAIVYEFAGTLLAIISLGAYWLGFRKARGLFLSLLGGLATMGLGGIGVELLNWHLLCTRWQSLGLCHRVVVLEEFLEMAGGSIVLAGLVSYARARLNDVDWRLARIALAGAGVLFSALLAGNIWILPGIEARQLAEPVQAEYFDGALSLAGYQISNDGTLAPGDDLTVKLYWVVDRHFPADYFLSVHVLTHPDITSVAQEDRPLGGWEGWRTTTWFPGQVMREVVHLDLPEKLPASDGYWLIVRVWLPTEEGPLNWETAERIIVTETDHELFEPETLILSDLNVAPETTN